MGTLLNESHLKTSGLRGATESSEIYVEPTELGTTNAFVLHLVEVFAVVLIRIGEDHDAVAVGTEAALPVLILIYIRDVGGIDDELTAKSEDAVDVAKEAGKGVEGADDADAVHQHEDGVVAIGDGPEILLQGVPDALGAHGLDCEGRDVDGGDIDASLLEGETVASGTGTDIEGAAGGEAEGGLFEVGHLVEGAEEFIDGHLVFVEIGGEDAEASCDAVSPVVGDGCTHRVFVFRHGCFLQKDWQLQS